MSLPKPGHEWQIAGARNKLSEVTDRALDGKPQRIVCRGRSVVVIDEKTLIRHGQPPPTFVEHLLAIPKMGDGFDIPPRS